MSSEVGIRPGLDPVLHVIVVVVDADTTHGIPSMITEFSVETAEKPVPVKITSVFPVTVPNLGSMEVSKGVEVP
mgnify:CR=1 FL=1